MLDVDISMKDILLSLAAAIDLENPLLEGHHKRVACIAWFLADSLQMTEREKTDVVAASLIHDIGCLSLQDRLNILDFDEIEAEPHCYSAYLILREFRPFKRLADIIRFHHLPWNQRNNVIDDGYTFYEESAVIYLADRIDSLIDREKNILSQADYISARIRSESELRFNPEIVSAFESIKNRESFWLSISETYLDTRLEEIFNSYSMLLDWNDMLVFSKVLGYLIDFKSHFTATHTSGVAAVSSRMAELMGFSKSEVMMMEVAGNLHDIGKLAVPGEILEKSAGLDFDEFSVIREHTFHTFNILKRIRGLETVNQWASFHHETMDGNGYPFHKQSDELPLGSKIVTIADIFTALNEDRPYRKGLSKESTLLTFKEFILADRIDTEVFKVLVDNYDELEDVRKSAQNEASEFYRMFREKINRLAG